MFIVYAEGSITLITHLKLRSRRGNCSIEHTFRKRKMSNGKYLTRSSHNDIIGGYTLHHLWEKGILSLYERTQHTEEIEIDPSFIC